MIKIIRSTGRDSELLAEIGRVSFFESHGRSASAEDINSYVNRKYTPQVFEQELSDPNNIFFTLYHKDKPAGYSKIIFNSPESNIQLSHVTKLERLYLLKEFYGLKLGLELLNLNINLAKERGQTGMWLYVWTENKRAVEFYKRTGFKVMGHHNFKISATHANPNYQMLLLF